MNFELLVRSRSSDGNDSVTYDLEDALVALEAFDDGSVSADQLELIETLVQGQPELIDKLASFVFQHGDVLHSVSSNA